MITINNKITEESCFLYGPDNVLIGEIKNDLAFLDVRCQVQDKKLKGYYIVFKNTRHNIDENGRVLNYPQTLFVKNERYLEKLICWD